jgi:hypothetical protein
MMHAIAFAVPLALLSVDASAEGAWVALSAQIPSLVRSRQLESRFETLLTQKGVPTERSSGSAAVTAWWQVLTATSVAFRRKQLSSLDALAQAGVVDRGRLAQFEDDLLVDEGRPQRYGTALRVIGDTLLLLPIADPDAVDSRRMSVGLLPLAQYLDLMERLHGKRVSRVRVQ